MFVLFFGFVFCFSLLVGGKGRGGEPGILLETKLEKKKKTNETVVTAASTYGWIYRFSYPIRGERDG